MLALDGKSLSAKVAVLVLVGAANLFGTKLGQVVGKWFLTRSARKRALGWWRRQGRPKSAWTTSSDC